MQEKVSKFFDQFPITEYRKGDVVIFANTSLSSVYYIESGSVSQYDVDDRGKRHIINTFKAKAFFPMSNAVNNVDTPYFFDAEEKSVKIRKAPASLVVKFIKQNPDVLYDLLQRTYRGTDGLLAKLSELMHGDAESIVMKELYVLMKRFGSEPVEGGNKLKRKVTETELAERTGLARETINRVIARLKDKGTLDQSRGYFVLMDFSSY